MNYETLTFDVLDTRVAVITLNRPQQLNAINEQLAREWRIALQGCADSSDVRTVVITGSGRGFCAGQDLKTLADGPPAGQLLREWYFPIIRGIRGLAKPVIAAINGTAVGAGCNLPLACDLRFAADTARFGEVFVGIGVIPDAGGYFFLPRLVGTGKATELMFSGEIFDAAEAERIGLVNRVYPAADLLPRTLEYAARLAAGPTHAYAMIKRGLALSEIGTLEETFEFEATGQEATQKTYDAREGIAAFLEKRSPVFRGQ